MTRAPNPDNLVIRDSILWVLRDGVARTAKELEVAIGTAPHTAKWGAAVSPSGSRPAPYLAPQLQALCRLGELERIRVGGDRSVAYRRVKFDEATDEAFEALAAEASHG